MTMTPKERERVIVGLSSTSSDFVQVFQADSNGPNNRGFPAQRRPGDNFEAWWQDQLSETETRYIEQDAELHAAVLHRASSGTFIDAAEVLAD